VHGHNVRDFPQAKLDSKINARVLLNKNGDLYFLLHCIEKLFWCTNYSLKGKKLGKKSFGRKKVIVERVHKTVT